MTEIRRFNWLPQPSAWKQMEAWRARRASYASDAMAATDNFNALFSQAHTNQISGLAKLAGQAAVKRINLAAKAKFDAIANTKIKGLDDLSVDKKV